MHKTKFVERYLHKSRDQLINLLVNRENIIHHACDRDDEWLEVEKFLRKIVFFMSTQNMDVCREMS